MCRLSVYGLLVTFGKNREKSGLVPAAMQAYGSEWKNAVVLRYVTRAIGMNFRREKACKVSNLHSEHLIVLIVEIQLYF